MKKVLFVLLVISALVPAFGQEIDSRYSRAVMNLQADRELIKKINKFFKVKPTKCNLKFHVSDYVTFISINGFQLIFPELEGLPEELSNSFETYPSEFLGALLPAKEGDLVLYFSKPVDHFLSAELFEKETYHISSYYGGRGFKLLFEFDEDGHVKKVYGVKYAHN